MVWMPDSMSNSMLKRRSSPCDRVVTARRTARATTSEANRNSPAPSTGMAANAGERCRIAATYSAEKGRSSSTWKAAPE